jgi:hypothetical protein
MALCGGFAMLEELDLTETLLRFFQSLVGPTKIFALAGDDLVAVFHFFDHGCTPAS